MRKYLYWILIIFGFILSYKVFADEVADKTDGSFVGDNPTKPINSSFVGDISNSMVNESAQQENVQKDTDGTFVDDGNTNAQNSYFAGESYQQQVSSSTDTPFAGDHTFVGNDYGR